MQTFTSSVNMLWGVLSVVAEILTIVLIIACFSKTVADSSLAQFFKRHSLMVAFIVSLLATAGSLTYSNIIGYAPCELCWFQRIFMYPQVILMGIALCRKDLWMRLYGVVLSVIGALISFYHISGQWGITSLPCSVAAGAVSCARQYTDIFGYITIPVMAFSAFVLIAMTLLFSMKKEAVL